jgi:hypothetical protein
MYTVEIISDFKYDFKYDINSDEANRCIEIKEDFNLTDMIREIRQRREICDGKIAKKKFQNAKKKEKKKQKKLENKEKKKRKL